MTKKLGPLIVDVAGTSLSADDKEILNHPLVGGVILFARNYQSKAELVALVKSMRAARETPLLIMVDQEGGRVQRFIDEFTRLPAAAHFSQLYDQNKKEALKQATQSGKLMASELLSVGIDLSLAPVLDLNKGISQVIGTRAFHETPHGVTELAWAYIQGMHEAGMASTGKHFPGHGSVATDSHLGIPVDTRSMKEIEQSDLIPFVNLIKMGVKAILAAHIIFPEIDNHAAGFSRYWLQDVLRNKLGFTGTILTDDLHMEGANISANYADRVVKARESGCDFTLLCNNRTGVIQVLDSVSHEAHFVPYERWANLKVDFSKQSLKQHS